MEVMEVMGDKEVMGDMGDKVDKVDKVDGGRTIFSLFSCRVILAGRRRVLRATGEPRQRHLNTFPNEPSPIMWRISRSGILKPAGGR